MLYTVFVPFKICHMLLLYLWIQWIHCLLRACLEGRIALNRPRPSGVQSVMAGMHSSLDPLMFMIIRDARFFFLQPLLPIHNLILNYVGLHSLYMITVCEQNVVHVVQPSYLHYS